MLDIPLLSLLCRVSKGGTGFGGEESRVLAFALGVEWDALTDDIQALWSSNALRRLSSSTLRERRFILSRFFFDGLDFFDFLGIVPSFLSLATHKKKVEVPKIDVCTPQKFLEEEVSNETAKDMLESDKWKRLEKYAIFRQKKFPLFDLPGEVLAYMFGRFLSENDVLSVFSALTYNLPSRICFVPRELRVQLVVSNVYRNLRDYLYFLSAECMYAAVSCHCVRAYIDWSPFSENEGGWVAQYRWNHNGRNKVDVSLNEISICVQLLESATRMRPGGYLSMYRCNLEGREVRLCLRPFASTHVDLLPYNENEMEYTSYLLREYTE